MYDMLYVVSCKLISGMVVLAFTKDLTYPLPGQPFNDEFTACDDRTFTTGDKRILIGE